MIQKGAAKCLFIESQISHVLRFFLLEFSLYHRFITDFSCWNDYQVLQHSTTRTTECLENYLRPLKIDVWVPSYGGGADGGCGGSDGDNGNSGGTTAGDSVGRDDCGAGGGGEGGDGDDDGDLNDGGGDNSNSGGTAAGDSDNADGNDGDCSGGRDKAYKTIAAICSNLSFFRFSMVEKLGKMVTRISFLFWLVIPIFSMVLVYRLFFKKW